LTVHFSLIKKILRWLRDTKRTGHNTPVSKDEMIKVLGYKRRRDRVKKSQNEVIEIDLAHL